MFSSTGHSQPAPKRGTYIVANGFPSSYGGGEARAEGAAGRCWAQRLWSVAISPSAASAALTPVHDKT